MLSNPLHRFSPYNTTTTTLVPTAHMHTAGMDALAQGSHYALQLQHGSPPYAQNSHQTAHQTKHQAKHRQGAYGTRTTAAGPVRRRISRACDQCNQLRTKCDGQHPCAHCIELGLGCEYIRERKKRGKASRKDLAQQAAQAATQNHRAGSSVDAHGDGDDDQTDHRPDLSASIGSTDGSDSDKTVHDLVDDAIHRSQRTGSMDSLGDMGDLHRHQQQQQQQQQQQPYLDLNGYDAAVMHNPYDRHHHIMGAAPHTPFSPSYPDLPYATLQAHSPTAYASGDGTFRIAASPMTAYHTVAGTGEPVSPSWMSSPPPPQEQQRQTPEKQTQQPPYHSPQTMSAAAAAAAAAAAHMHSFNGMAMHNLHPAMHPALTGVGPLSRRTSPGTASAPTAAAAPPNTPTALLRYPVLAPLAPYLAAIMPLPLACDLVDVYFSSASSAQMHPMSPYVLGFVFRKRSFLHATAPRPCQPALLASMLWVAAQTSDAPLIASVPAARGAICQKLLELTVSLLKPLVPLVPTRRAAVDGQPRQQQTDSPVFDVAGAAGTIDDVVTYAHLATVVSASEYKGASLRWWNAAWCLARELRLGREVHGDGELELELDLDLDLTSTSTSISADRMSDEAREERRRIWWLVYMVDRHLALCYNRPLFLLDVECDGLRRPMDDTAWQAGEFGCRSSSSRSSNASGSSACGSAGSTHSGAGAAATPDTSSDTVVSGPSYVCSGHSIFGYFLPLMTILGEIVDLHHARNHPRFGLGCGFRSSHAWDAQIAAITHHLAVYEQSLKAFEQRTLSPAALIASNEVSAAAAAAAAAATTDASNHASNHAASVEGQSRASASALPHDTPAMPLSTLALAPLADMPPLPPRMTELDIQTRTVAAYGTHVMHVLHILLAGKWDPVNLLDDNDLWISTQGFITATGHAVAAAEAISEILEYDPGLERMPFFFGIYLLQGSFLLLLIADKLQLEASNSVVRACETIIRAHEACVVTLSTEYQRNFSRVMRSALAQARGRVPEDLGEQHMRRRELLSLYRWTGDGTGLAL